MIWRRVRPTLVLYRITLPRRLGSTCQNIAAMSAQQPSWNVPTRQVEEPVLKVYNSLTKTKVCFLIIDVSQLHVCIGGIRSEVRPPRQVVQLRAHGIRRLSHGSCKVSRVRSSHGGRALTMFALKKLRHPRHTSQNSLRLFWLRRSFCCEHHRHR